MAKKRDGLYQRKRKDGSRGAWIWDVEIEGNRIVRSFDSELTRKQAQKLASIERGNIILGKAGIRKKRDISFDQAADLFLEHSAQNPKWRTVRYHKQCIAKLTEEFSGKRLSQITTFGVESYRRKRTPKAKIRVNRETDVLRLLFNKMIEWGKYEGPNPAKGIKKRPEPQNTVRFLDGHEETRLLAACREVLRAILILGIHCGLRIEAEALPLKWKAVNFKQGERGMLTIESRTEKTTKIRHIPLNEVARAALEAHCNRSTATAPDDPVFVNRLGKPLRSIRTIFEAARRRAALEDAGTSQSVTLHVMRHTFASRLVMAGMDLRSIQKLGGWSSLKMLERYSHLSPGHLQRAVDALVVRDSQLDSQQGEMDGSDAHLNQVDMKIRRRS